MDNRKDTQATRGPPENSVKLSRDVFPPFGKSHSEANEIATRWAHSKETKAEGQKLVSYHGKWYIIEAFDSSDLGYQIVGALSESQYNAYLKETGENGRVQGVQGSVDRFVELDQGANPDVRGESGLDSTFAQHTGENDEIRNVGKGPRTGREGSGNRSGDLQGGSTRLKIKTQFSVETPIEETKDLIAVHNVSEQGLLGALELGGLPSPSIAITKADMGHTKYGDISLVFSKDTVDPQLFRSNKVYGSDAWTPTAPKVEYPVDSKKLFSVERDFHKLAGSTDVGIGPRKGAFSRAPGAARKESAAPARGSRAGAAYFIAYFCRTSFRAFSATLSAQRP